MKKGWKIFWIVCGSCFGIGFVLCVAALILGVTGDQIEGRFPDGIHIGKHVGIFRREPESTAPTTPSGESDDRQVFTGVRSIDAEIWEGDFEIRSASSDTQEIVVETQDIDPRLGLKYYMDGGELTFKTKEKLTGINDANGVGKIYVYIPQNYSFDEVSLDMEFGRLTTGFIQAREFSVDVSAGEAVIGGFSATEADFQCGAGRIEVTGAEAREVDIECGVGEVDYTAVGNQQDYNYQLECGVGEIVCGDNRYSGIGTKQNIRNGSREEINIECGMGKVVVRFAGNNPA